MAVNLINGNDTQIVKTNDDIQVEFSQSRGQQIDNIETDIENLQIEFDNKLPVTLYENSTGSYSNIVLSDSAANYSKLYIETKGLQYTDYIKSNSLVIDNPNGKTVSTSNTFYNFSNNQIYVVNTIFTINGTSIVISGNQAGTVGANNAYGSNGNCLGITKVLGYK